MLNFGPGTRGPVSREDDTRLCPYRGCDEIIPISARACPEHKNMMSEAEATRRKNHPRNLIYSDPRWRACRQYVKMRDHYTCRTCGAVGVRLVVDHDYPGGVLACPDPFDPKYCVTLCLVCSGKKDGARSRGKA